MYDKLSFVERHVSLRKRHYKQNVSHINTHVFALRIYVSCSGSRERLVVIHMKETTGYFVVKEKAVPEVLLKVVEAKRLLETEKVLTIQEAVDAVGISRSSFYKYKDDIFQFHDNSQGKTITLTFQMDDEPGLLSEVLGVISQFGANILTIHQSIPINGMASLSLSIQILQTTGNVSQMIAEMENKQGVHHVKILAKE